LYVETKKPPKDGGLIFIFGLQPHISHFCEKAPWPFQARLPPCSSRDS